MAQSYTGPIKAGLGTLIGNAGEYFVVAELLKRGVVAALAPRNNRGFDVLATDGVRSINIRVKTKSPAAQSWVWNAKSDGTIFTFMSDNDLTICVDLGDLSSSAVYYVFKTAELEDSLRKDYESWVATPGNNGKPHNPANPQRRLGNWAPHVELLETAKNRWSLVHQALSRQETARRFGDTTATEKGKESSPEQAKLGGLFPGLDISDEEIEAAKHSVIRKLDDL